MSEIKKFWQFAQTLADAGRTVTLPYFRNEVSVENKQDASPVTIADKKCEERLRNLITDEYPQHAIYGEEFGGSLDAEFAWVLDPIDGTRSFISGSRQYCTLIALLHNGAPLIGVIDMPALDERWMGYDSPQYKFAQFCYKPCKVSRQQNLARAIMATTTVAVADDADNAEDVALRRLCKAAGHTRLGGDASAFGSLASGFVDVAADYEMACYDYLPIMPIARAAGGVISDWNGDNMPRLNGKIGIVAAATQNLHRQALEVLAQK